MKVKSDWWTKAGCIVMWIMYVHVWLDNNVRIILILPGIFLLSLTFVFCRTITMNESGCTIRFGLYKRVCKWEEFHIKRMENTNRYLETVYFANGMIDRPIKKPALYTVVMHPLSSFYITILNEKEKNEFRTGTEDCVLVGTSRSEFLKQLEDWGVELEFCGYSSKEKQ